MTETKTVSAKVLRDFNDAGTERPFSQGATIEITPGEFANYEAAGLVAPVDGDTTAEPTGRKPAK